MRRLLVRVAAATAVTGAALVPVVGPASAGTGPGTVDIVRLGQQTAPYHGTVTVKPPVRVYGNAQARRRRLWVRQGGTTLVSGAGQATLGPGFYRVTTRVRYRTWTLLHKELTLAAGTKVTAGGHGDLVPRLDGCRVASVADGQSPSGTLTFSCAVSVWNAAAGKRLYLPDVQVPGTYAPGEYDPSVTEFFYAGKYAGFVDTLPQLVGASADFLTAIKLPADVHVGYRVRDYSLWQSKSRTQDLRVVEAPKPRTCATYRNYKAVRVNFDHPRRGDYKTMVASKLHSKGTRYSFEDDNGRITEFRQYRACAPNTVVLVGFINGWAYSKHYIQ